MVTKIENADVKAVFKSVPKHIRDKMLSLRELILETASEVEEVGKVQETLKWGEVSYVTKTGSTIRLGWNTDTNQYGIYFHCRTRLVATFREIYPGGFKFEGNRGLIFSPSDKIPVSKLKHCISIALTYHRRKQLSMLGM